MLCPGVRPPSADSEHAAACRNLPARRPGNKPGARPPPLALTVPTWLGRCQVYECPGGQRAYELPTLFATRGPTQCQHQAPRLRLRPEAWLRSRCLQLKKKTLARKGGAGRTADGGRTGLLAAGPPACLLHPPHPVPGLCSSHPPGPHHTPADKLPSCLTSMMGQPAPGLRTEPGRGVRRPHETPTPTSDKSPTRAERTEAASAPRLLGFWTG